MSSEGLIGSLDWDDCTRCVHSDPKTGVCDVDNQLDYNIILEYDYIYCGLFEKEE
jgi:hypothetical protein